MSGGSLDYISYKVEECADTIRERRPHDYLLQALAIHLYKLKDVLYNVELELSGDASLSEEEKKKIGELIGDDKELECCMEHAVRVRDELNRLIK